MSLSKLMRSERVCRVLPKQQSRKKQQFNDGCFIAFSHSNQPKNCIGPQKDPVILHLEKFLEIRLFENASEPYYHELQLPPPNIHEWLNTTSNYSFTKYSNGNIPPRVLR